MLSVELKGRVFPEIPPKLNGKKLTDAMIDGRRQELEIYLSELIAIKPIPKKVLEFIEYNSLEGAENMADMRVVINTSDIVIDD